MTLTRDLTGIDFRKQIDSTMFKSNNIANYAV